MFSIVIHPNKHTIMKKLILAAVIIVSCLTFKNANAQIHFSVGVNIGSQPEWGPVGYDRVAYYYMPDIDGYYDVNAHQYIYLDGGVWVHRTYLPYRYRNYDLYHGYKVVVNDRDPYGVAAAADVSVTHKRLPGGCVPCAYRAASAPSPLRILSGENISSACQFLKMPLSRVRAAYRCSCVRTWKSSESASAR